MAEAAEYDSALQIHTENIGGIAHSEVSFTPGVTILAGENATNRTSFLQAIMAALGSRNVSLKADSSSGSVKMEIGSETYTRYLERTNGTVSFDGEPYLDDPELADLFAFLLEGNEARQAVSSTMGDLRSVIMKPIDTAAIEAEIQEFEVKKRNLDERIDELEQLKESLPSLEERATQLETDIEGKREELADLREEIAETEADLQETKQTKEQLETKLDEVQAVRSKFEHVTTRLETERESIEALRSEKESLTEQLAELPESVSTERREINSRLSDLRSRKTTLETEMSELQNLIQFNEDFLRGDKGLLDALERERDSSDVTAQLVEEETVVCWTCGSGVKRDQIKATVERLRELREETLVEVNDLEAEIAELKSEKQSLESRKQERKRIEGDIANVEREIEDRSEAIEDLETRREELDAEIEQLEAEIEDLELSENHGELLDLHQEANRLELEIERLESEREDVRGEIDEINSRLDERDELVEEREGISEKLTELRTRIERIEKDAVTEFNDRIEAVLELMDYENIERIWIERKGATNGRRNSPDSTAEFELHVVRSDESGAAYEDSVEHLSESEREVTGLIFALAGYLVHEVYEDVPFMLLDSVEALDSSRIAKLVDYFESEAEYLVIALLEEDARELDDSYQRVTEI